MQDYTISQLEANFLTMIGNTALKDTDLYRKVTEALGAEYQSLSPTDKAFIQYAYAVIYDSWYNDDGNDEAFWANDFNYLDTIAPLTFGLILEVIFG